jgi:hypothetical protein
MKGSKRQRKKKRIGTRRRRNRVIKSWLRSLADRPITTTEIAERLYWNHLINNDGPRRYCVRVTDLETEPNP